MYIADTKTWYLERFIRLLAGVLVLGACSSGTSSTRGVHFYRLRGPDAHDFCLDRVLPHGYYTLRFRSARAV
jgi:hypothetical protein